MNLDFFDRFKTHLKRDPNRVAFLSLSAGGREEFSYQKMAHEIRLVSRFLSEQGVQSGTTVAILMENHPRWGMAFLAAQSAGAVILPLDVNHSAETLSFLIDHAESQFVICSEQMLPTLEKIQGLRKEALPAVVVGDSKDRYPEWEKIIGSNSSEGISLPLVQRDLDERLILMYTSGTTGDPKGVALSQHSIYENIYLALNIIEVRPEDHFLAILPLYHILSLLVNFLAPLWSGAQVTLLDDLDAQKIMKTFREEKISVFVCVPQFYYMIHRRITHEIAKQSWSKRFVFNRLLALSKFSRKYLGYNLAKTVFRSIHAPFGESFRLFGAGGARFDPAVAQSLTDLGFDFIQAYGMTETACIVSVTPPSDNEIGSVGKAMPNCEVRIDAPDAEGIGEVLVRGTNLMQCYFKNAAATEEAITEDGWLHTGDLGYLSERGSIYITGRKKDVIVLSSGKNIFPDEIEHFYQSNCSFIKEMCVLGIEDQASGGIHEKLHAVIVPDFDQLKKEGIVNTAEMIRYLLETLSQKLPSHKRVLSFDVRQTPLPRTTTQKIKRFQVQEELQQGEKVAPEKEEAWKPETEVEVRIAALLHEVKPGASVSPNANLELDLGFESLERVEFLSSVQETLDIDISDEEATSLFTVSDVIAFVNDRLESGGNGGAHRKKTWDEILDEPLDADEQAMVQERLRRRGFVEFLFVLTTWIAWILGKLLFRLKGKGLENLPRDYPFMICPNHVSFLDAFLVAALLPPRVIRRFFALGYSDYFAEGITSYLGKLVKTIPVDPDRKLRQALRLGAEGLRRELVLCVFPEGERSIDGTLKTFRGGPAILATKMKVPVVPVGIIGAYEAWRRGSSDIRLHPIEIRFGKPIQPEPEESIEDFNARLFKAVEKLVAGDH
ncbi:MAG: AMP-binding protein [Acidobacteriota bacterium]|nr:MAG: AMP-binding protein [Acidobacteriota bacterium]